MLNKLVWALLLLCTAHAHPQCPSGWTSGNVDLTHCYKLINEPKNWQNAQAECAKQQGTLAVIANTAEMNYVKTIEPRSWVWMGSQMVLMKYGAADMSAWIGKDKLTNCIFRNDNLRRNELDALTCSFNLPFLCQIDLPPDCLEILVKNPRAQDGVYTIYPNRQIKYAIQVYCEMALGGWTTIMRRVANVPLNWQASHYQYVVGFGDVKSDHWRGLSLMLSMASYTPTTLRVQGSNQPTGTPNYYSEHENFKLGSGGTLYRLNIGRRTRYAGEAADSLMKMNNSQFLGFDKAQGAYNQCAERTKGGWWFRPVFATGPPCSYICPTCDGIYERQILSPPTNFKFWKVLIRRNAEAVPAQYRNIL